jgi:hypothetical protein
MENIYYIYVHYKKGTNIPFYIGRGQRSRICQKTNGRNQHWKNIVNKYGGFEYDKLEENLTNDEANFYEEFYISLFKSWGFKLVNVLSGGNQNKRPDVSKYLKENNPMKREDVRQKMSLIHKNRIISKETRDKMSKSLKGNITWMEGNKNGKGNKGKIKDICILDPETGIFYNSIEAANLVDYHPSHLLRCLKGDRKNKTRLKLV